jgi:hypothetical protein
VRTLGWSSRPLIFIATAGAIVLLGISFAFPWYGISTNASTSNFSYSANTQFYLGPNYNIQHTQTPAGGSPTGGAYTYSYAGHLNATGNLYALTAILVVLTIVLGLGGIVMALLSPTRGRFFSRMAIILLILAFLVSIATPLVLVASQPGAIANDTGAMYPSGAASPSNSFVGSCSGSQCQPPGAANPYSSETISWGPSVGWALSMGAMALMLVALVAVRAPARSDHVLLRPVNSPKRRVNGAWQAPPAAQPREVMETPAAIRQLDAQNQSSEPPKWVKPPE